VRKDGRNESEDLNIAARNALINMIDYIVDTRGYTREQAYCLTSVAVDLMHAKIYATDCAECETKSGMLDQIDRVIAMEGDLDPEQRKKLLEIADKCPVHRTLTSEIHIVTKAAD